MKMLLNSKVILNLALFAFTLVIIGILPDVAIAQTSSGGGAGGSLKTDVVGILTGNLGTVVGLGVSLFGLWVWLAQQSSWGLLIVIAGAAVTAFPGLYSGMAQGFAAAFGSSGAGRTLNP
jgi:hypothetical protein